MDSVRSTSVDASQLTCSPTRPASCWRNALLLGGVFLAMALVQVDLPGLYMDEAYIDAFTVKILDPSTVAERPLYNLPDNVLDRTYRWPMCGGIYVGLIGTYLGVPYYSLFGMNLFSLRFYHALYGVATVMLVYFILRRTTGRRVAFWATLLLALDASFLITYRTHGWNVIAPMPFFLGAIFLALPRHEEENVPLSGRRTLVIGLLYGLACYGYFTYLLFGPPLVLAILVFGRHRLTRRNVLLGGLGLLIGYAPLFYALASIYSIAPNLIASFVERTGTGEPWVARMASIWQTLRHTLNDSHVPQEIAGPCFVRFAGLKAWLWLGVAAAAPVVLVLCRKRGLSRVGQHPEHGCDGNTIHPIITAPSWVLLATCLVTIVFYVVTLVKFGGQIRVHHVVLIMPLCYMALGALVHVLNGCTKNGKGVAQYAGTPGPYDRWTGRASIAVMVVSTLILVPLNLRQHWRTIEQLRITGGVGLWSNAIDFLAADLRMYHSNDKVVFCDWGYMLPTHFLTRGAIRFTWDIGNTAEEMETKLPPLFADNPRLVFILPARPINLFAKRSVADMRGQILAIAARLGCRVEAQQTFLQRDGVPVVEKLVLVADQHHSYQNKSEKTFSQRDGQLVMETITLAKAPKQLDSKEGDPHHAETRHGRNRALLASRTP